MKSLVLQKITINFLSKFFFCSIRSFANFCHGLVSDSLLREQSRVKNIFYTLYKKVTTGFTYDLFQAIDCIDNSSKSKPKTPGFKQNIYKCAWTISLNHPMWNPETACFEMFNMFCWLKICSLCHTEQGTSPMDAHKTGHLISIRQWITSK